MSISSELLTLNNTKTAIRTAINNKGGSVTSSTPFADYATAIANLPSGGSGNPLLESIDVSDFTGTTFNDARSYITDVNIPNTVTTISNSAFQSFTGITSITFPNSTTSVGENAFKGCTGLTSINFGGVTQTSYGSFSGCTGLTSVTIGPNVISVGQETFADCTNLASVTIGSNVTTLGSQVFIRCTGLTSITIPDTVTTLGSGLFNACTNLASVTLSSNITTLPTTFFYNCSSLASFTISDTVTSIGSGTFYGTGLTSITIPSSVSSIGNNCFYNSRSLTHIVVNSVTPPTIGQYGVFDNTNNCPIYVPAESVDAYKAATNWSNYASRIYPIQQVATVDGNPVYNYDLGMTSTDSITSENIAKMPAGTSLELAEGITWAGGATAFSNYTNLTLPSTFATFGDQNMLDGLTTVTSKATTPPSAERNQIGGSSLTAIYVPAASVDTYKAAGGWSSYADRIQAIPAE